MKKVAIVLAAGKGKRMNSELPKVLIEVCGRPMIDYVLDALQAGGIDETVVVIGYEADRVRAALANRPGLRFAVQKEQLGTGHAVASARELIADHQGPVLVVTGDAPMMRSESVMALINDFADRQAACVLGTAHKDDPTGLGRIVRDADGQFVGIVEEKDASDAQRKITEINMSYYVFDCQALLSALTELRADNVQGEYYITDCPGIMVSRGLPVRALGALHPTESLGVNTVEELAVVERAMREIA